MAQQMSKTQIDRLGDRLKKGNITEDDLRLLDLYRRSFTDAYEIVIGEIRNKLKLEPTGRPAKSTTSISEKLRRESIRLTQIQDIAGCRLTVSDIANQDLVVQQLNDLFNNSIVVDRRQKPSHGYRAVHVIVSCLDKMVEIQVRTALQHLWAELSEKLSDVVEPAVKYGGGDEIVRELLERASSLVNEEELMEMKLAQKQAQLSSEAWLTSDIKKALSTAQEIVDSSRQMVLTRLRDTIHHVEGIKKGEKDDLPD